MPRQKVDMELFIFTWDLLPKMQSCLIIYAVLLDYIIGS